MKMWRTRCLALFLLVFISGQRVCFSSRARELYVSFGHRYLSFDGRSKGPPYKHKNFMILGSRESDDCHPWVRQFDARTSGTSKAD